MSQLMKKKNLPDEISQETKRNINYFYKYRINLTSERYYSISNICYLVQLHLAIRTKFVNDDRSNGE